MVPNHALPMCVWRLETTGIDPAHERGGGRSVASNHAEWLQRMEDVPPAGIGSAGDFQDPLTDILS